MLQSDQKSFPILFYVELLCVPLNLFELIEPLQCSVS